MTRQLLTQDQFLEDQLQDPAFRAAWEASEPAYQLKRLRLLKKLSQAELAKKVGTRQPSIARLENGTGLKNLAFVRRVAEALGAEVEIQIRPKTASLKYASAKRQRAKK